MSDEDGLTITVNNLTQHVWQRSLWSVGAGTEPGLNWTDEITSVPSLTLEVGDGASTASAVQAHLGWLARDAMYIGVGYKCADLGHDLAEFGVMIRQNFALLTVGWQSEWTHNPGNGYWTPYTTDASKFTWNFEDGSNALAQPTLGNGFGTISIQINPPPINPP